LSALALNLRRGNSRNNLMVGVLADAPPPGAMLLPIAVVNDEDGVVVGRDVGRGHGDRRSSFSACRVGKRSRQNPR